MAYRCVISSLIIFIIIIICSVKCISLPTNKYYYMLARNELRDMEKKSHNFKGLSNRERVVHFQLEALKQIEYSETSSRFYPSLPIEDVYKEIKMRPLYELLKKLPKGGNLHMHEPEMLDRRIFLELIKNDPELYEMLYICDKITNPSCKQSYKACNCSAYQLRYFATHKPEAGWTKIKNSVWTIEAILNKTTLIGLFSNIKQKLLPTDSNGRWRVANEAGDFTFYSPLINHLKTRLIYLKACLDLSLSENVQIVEFRRENFGNLFDFDKDGNEIKISISDELKILDNFKKDYLNKNSKLIDFVFLIYGIRRFSKEEILKDVRLAIQTQKSYPTLIRGYDLVGEEDLGHTLLFHSDSLIEAFNYMTKGSANTFSLNFHVAETNWPDDYKPALFGDDVNTINNIYDSLLLHTHRIGHGLGFIKHPELYSYIKNNSIAFEVCPTSNQILGFVPDLRSHPALNYFRSGIPIVIAGDDPGSFGYNELTVDFYMIFMAWGLNLADLKEISKNSIVYSTIPEDVKKIGHLKFDKQWNEFIDFMYMRTCSQKNNLSKIDFNDMQPSFGPYNKKNNISFFGYDFEQGYCLNITCLFGRGSTTVKTKCEMKTLNEIECETPLGFKSQITVPISLIFNEKLIRTKFNYTFMSEKYFHQPKSEVKGRFLDKVLRVFSGLYKGVAKSIFD